MVFYVYADLCSLLAATSQFSILIGQNMQLTGCHNGNELRNAICVDSKISIEWPHCSFLYCGRIFEFECLNSLMSLEMRKTLKLGIFMLTLRINLRILGLIGDLKHSNSNMRH